MAHDPGSKPQVFISYSRDDRGSVYPDADWLRKLGFAVHIDRHITPGAQWREAVAEAIAESDLVLFYASPTAVESQFCSQELQFALSRDIPVITVMLKDTKLPPWMELALGDHQILQRFELSHLAYRSLLESGLNAQLDRERIAPPQLASPTSSSRISWLVVTVSAILSMAAGAWYFTQETPATIAVFPFETDGSSAAKNISTNISTELSQGLVNLGLLPVITSRSSAITGSAAPTENGYLVTGYVQSVDTGYRIRTSLVAPGTSQQLWAQTYVYLDLESDQVQRRHVRNVLKALPDVLAGNLPELDYSTPSSRTTAQSLYQQGAQILAQPSEGQDLDRVRQLFEQALDDYPGYGAPLLGLCDVHLRIYDSSREINLLVEAETRCLQALAVGSESLNAHLSLGRVFALRGEAEVARTHFQRASAMAPDNPQAWTGLAGIAETNGDPDLAAEYHQRAVNKPTADWQAHLAYGSYLFDQGNFATAAEQYQIVVDLHPESVAAFTNLGTASYNLGDFDRASDAWQRANDIAPNAMSWGNLGAAYTYLEDYTAAADAYRYATEMAPEDHRWLGHLGEIMIYDKNADKIAAKQIIQRALDLALSQLEYTQEDASVLARISTYDALLGLSREALDRARAAIREDEDSIQVAYSVLQTYTLLEEMTLAARERERLLGLGYPEWLLERDPWLN